GGCVAVSTSAQSVAERVMRLVGRPDLIDAPWLASGAERAAHAEELDVVVGALIGRLETDRVVRECEKAEAAIAPIYTAADIMVDPQFRALGTIAEVADDELGLIRMQNLLFRLSDTPGAIRWAGPALGAHTAEVLGGYGVDAE